MSKKFEDIDNLYSSIITLLSKDHRKLTCGFEKRMKNFTSGIENQEQLCRALDTASDAVQENLDKMRFECKDLQYECETLSKQIMEAEEKHRKILEESSQRDIEQKNRLAQIRAELKMYESILQIGIEDMANGKNRGVIFKSKGLAYCDLEGPDKLEEDKENINASHHQYSRLNSVYSQLEVSGQWKSFV